MVTGSLLTRDVSSVWKVAYALVRGSELGGVPSQSSRLWVVHLCDMLMAHIC